MEMGVDMGNVSVVGGSEGCGRRGLNVIDTIGPSVAAAASFGAFVRFSSAGCTLGKVYCVVC